MPERPTSKPALAVAAVAIVLGASLAPAAEPPPKRSASEVADGLRMPGDGYGPVDWANLPAWRQTSFFGIRSQGQVFVYVVDCSGSMDGGDRMTRAKAELRRSVGALDFPQRFHVIFYNDRPLPMPGGFPKSADGRAKVDFNAWLRSIEPEGETDPRGAMGQALNFRPDAVFLLSDGEFPPGTAEAIGQMNRRKIPIHCVDLSGGAGGNQLRQVAADSKGQYAARP